MPRKVVKVRMPEGGAEREYVVHEHHRCKQANALVRELGDDVDILQFPVGLAGQGMPRGVPFSVVSTDVCKACGALVGLWFVWTGPQVIEPKRSSALWTP